MIPVPLIISKHFLSLACSVTCVLTVYIYIYNSQFIEVQLRRGFNSQVSLFQCQFFHFLPGMLQLALTMKWISAMGSKDAPKDATRGSARRSPSPRARGTPTVPTQVRLRRTKIPSKTHLFCEFECAISTEA